MIQLEGWTESPLLPEGWIFKVFPKTCWFVWTYISRRFPLKFLSFHIQGAQSWRLWGGQGLQVHLQHWREALVLGDGLPHQGGGLLVLHGGGQGVHGKVAKVQL